MYTRCLFCTGDLGRNEALEAFPVGRRLAYDAAKGRLWVVCPRCARWNLTPLEERWEAIEQAERLYRKTRLRTSTENVGLARVADRAELVRIGRPLRPELAAWRYRPARDASRRAVQAAAAAGLAAGSLATAWIGLTVLPFTLADLALKPAAKLMLWARHGFPGTTVARISAPGGSLRVRRGDLLTTRVLPSRDGDLALRVSHSTGTTALSGDAAWRAAALLFPATTWLQGAAAYVPRAVSRLEHGGSAEQFLRDFARRGARLTRDETDRRARWMQGDGPVSREEDFDRGLLALDPSLRLAVEMALHEEQERRALEGELAELTRAWRDAEEIAAIADDLVLPGGVRKAFARLRHPAEPGG